MFSSGGEEAQFQFYAFTPFRKISGAGFDTRSPGYEPSMLLALLRKCWCRWDTLKESSVEAFEQSSEAEKFCRQT